MGLDNGVRNGCTPFRYADRQKGQTPVVGDVEKAVGEVPLALSAQARDPVGRNVVETCSDPGIDSAFRRDQGIRAEPLDGRHGRQDDKPPAALLDEASHQVLSGSCRLGMLCQPGLRLGNLGVSLCCDVSDSRSFSGRLQAENARSAKQGRNASQ